MAIAERQLEIVRGGDRASRLRPAIEPILRDLSQAFGATAATCAIFWPDGSGEIVAWTNNGSGTDNSHLEQLQPDQAAWRAGTPGQDHDAGPLSWKIINADDGRSPDQPNRRQAKRQASQRSRACSTATDAYAFVVELQRSADVAPFTEHEQASLIDHLDSLSPMFELMLSCLRLHRQLDLTSAAIDRLATGVMFVDHNGVIFGANEAAKEIVAEGDGLQATGHGVRASSPQQSLQLRSFLQHRNTPNVSFMALERPSGLRPLQISAHVARRSPGDAIIFIADSDADVRIDQEALIDFFGLTQKEARLAALLAEGYSPDEAARLMAVKVSTIRTHMARVLAKTGTRRQPELLSMIVRSLASLRRPENPR